MKKHLLVECDSVRAYTPFNIHIFFLQYRVGDDGHQDRVVTDGRSLKTPFLVDLLLLVCLQAFIVLYQQQYDYVILCLKCILNMNNIQIWTKSILPFPEFFSFILDIYCLI